MKLSRRSFLRGVTAFAATCGVASAIEPKKWVSEPDARVRPEHAGFQAVAGNPPPEPIDLIVPKGEFLLIRGPAKFRNIKVYGFLRIDGQVEVECLELHDSGGCGWDSHWTGRYTINMTAVLKGPAPPFTIKLKA